MVPPKTQKYSGAIKPLKTKAIFRLFAMFAGLASPLLKAGVPIAITQSESWVPSVGSGGKRFALVVRVGPANAVKPSCENYEEN